VKTITLVAYNRPHYTEQALEGLANCRGFCDFDRMAIFIDPGDHEVVEVCRAWSRAQPIQVEVFVNERRLGVADNPFKAYSHAFEYSSSDFNVALEDDAVLSPDAVELAVWFDRQHGAEMSRYTFLNLCDHYAYRGEKRNKGDVPEDPSLVAESVNLSSPFAWCFTRHQWPFVKRHWNKNTRSVLGWDWSIRFGMRVEGRIALTPVVSRCRNIGSLNATHESAETFRWQLGLRHSDGSHRGDFTIVNPVSPEQSKRLAPWMVQELPGYFERGRYPPDEGTYE
jgi:Glycosyltransferase like family 2